MVWWRTAWICDDAYLMFRTIEVWFAGHGPNFNPGQRAWGATSPLWFLLQSAGRLVYGDLYWVTLALSAICIGLTLYAAWRFLGDSLEWTLLALLFIGSRALLDYSSSGLEPPLSYALLTGFLAVYASLFQAEPTERRVWLLWSIAGVLLLTRHDLVLLIGPALAWVFVRLRTVLPARRWGFAIGAAAAPLLVWTMFSLFYHGAAFPPAVYSKLRYATYGDRTEVLLQGLKNLQVIAYDPISLVILAAGSVACLRRGSPYAPLAIGALLYLGVFTYHGGDWMDARIFTPPLIVFLPLAAHTLRAVAGRYLLPAVVAGALLSALWPDYPWVYQWPNNIVDHRRLMAGWNDFYRGAAVQYPQAQYRCPDWRRMREADLVDPNAVLPVVAVTSARFDPPFLADKYACGRFLRDTSFRIGGIDFESLGLFAYFAGPQKTIVERMLVDPLLTRLPPKYGGQYSHHTHMYFRPGHVWSDLPDGYVESLLSGENRIADPAIARLYDDVRLATEAPLLAPGRFAAIWRLNTGYDYGTDRPWHAVWEASTR